MATFETGDIITVGAFGIVKVTSLPFYSRIPTEPEILDTMTTGDVALVIGQDKDRFDRLSTMVLFNNTIGYVTTASILRLDQIRQQPKSGTQNGQDDPA